MILLHSTSVPQGCISLNAHMVDGRALSCHGKGGAPLDFPSRPGPWFTRKITKKTKAPGVPGGRSRDFATATARWTKGITRWLALPGGLTRWLGNQVLTKVVIR